MLAGFLTGAVLLAATTGGALSIENLRKYAGIVIDAKSGAVLYEKDADAKRYPASLTKVMTLYILFQELEAGTIKLDERMTVSAYAAAAVPTELGLRPGLTITVKEAMKSLVTLSANDMARVLAERISGSESEFAERMTRTARALGMSRTTYRNASGLPHAEHVTTARDQARLGAAIFQHFPQYYALFQTKSFSFGGRTYRNNNRLLGYEGVDGIKTGYITASGSNLLTAARRDDRHIVVAAIGFNSARARDSKVRELVKTYLSDASKGSYLETAEIAEPGRQGPVRLALAEPVIPKPYPAFRSVSVVVAAGPNESKAAGVDAVGIAETGLEAVHRVGSSTVSKDLTTPPVSSADAMAAWFSESYSLGATLKPQPASPISPSGPAGGEGDQEEVEVRGALAP